MTVGDAKICDEVRQKLKTTDIFDSEQEEQNATKFSTRRGVDKATLQVFNTGKMVVQGKHSGLKTWLEDLVSSIKSGSSTPTIMLPAEIEKFPQTLMDKVPACDGVVMWYFSESLKCYKADSVAGAVFMLGAASEKLILILIEKYASRIKHDDNRERFLERTKNKMISAKYDEFKRSSKASKTKPQDLLLAQDLDQMLDGNFHFYRTTRNTVGHPQIIPDLDKGVVLANLGMFITYTERIYGLIQFYDSTDVEV